MTSAGDKLAKGVAIYLGSIIAFALLFSSIWFVVIAVSIWAVWKLRTSARPRNFKRTVMEYTCLVLLLAIGVWDVVYQPKMEHAAEIEQSKRQAEFNKMSPQQHLNLAKSAWSNRGSDIEQARQEALRHLNTIQDSSDLAPERHQLEDKMAEDIELYNADQQATWKQKWYANEYNVHPSRVYIEQEPHDCEFETAPLGNKNCHYEKVITHDRH